MKLDAESLIRLLGKRIMCDVCRYERVDYKFKNGEKKQNLYSRSLYNVFSGHLVKIKLCYLHDSELFLIGETRFATRYAGFIMDLRDKNQKVHERNLPFGARYDSSPRIVF